MTPRQRILGLATAAVLGTAAVAATAPAQTADVSAKRITASGVGAVKLGKTYRELRRKGLVRRLRRGCPLARPRPRVARLTPPLSGSVEFARRRPRRATTISVTGGATARGVGIGDTLADIRSAFRRVRVDRSTAATFGIVLAKVPKRRGGRIQFTVSTTTRRIELVAVPTIRFCE